MSGEEDLITPTVIDQIYINASKAAFILWNDNCHIFQRF